jgi:hypothetical protein
MYLLYYSTRIASGILTQVGVHKYVKYPSDIEGNNSQNRTHVSEQDSLACTVWLREEGERRENVSEKNEVYSPY